MNSIVEVFKTTTICLMDSFSAGPIVCHSASWLTSCYTSSQSRKGAMTACFSFLSPPRMVGAPLSRLQSLQTASVSGVLDQYWTLHDTARKRCWL